VCTLGWTKQLTFNSRHSSFSRYRGSSEEFLILMCVKHGLSYKANYFQVLLTNDDSTIFGEELRPTHELEKNFSLTAWINCHFIQKLLSLVESGVC
jgi:hypothetical protein